MSGAEVIQGPSYRQWKRWHLKINLIKTTHERTEDTNIYCWTGTLCKIDGNTSKEHFPLDSVIGQQVFQKHW